LGTPSGLERDGPREERLDAAFSAGRLDAVPSRLSDESAQSRLRRLGTEGRRTGIETQRKPGLNVIDVALTGLWLALVIFWAAGCSIFMEANRPTPTNLHKFEVGQSRDSVRHRIGAPDDSVSQTDGTNCDSYQLYTKGYGAGGRAGVALLEGAADVLTLGLTEVVLTPTEVLTKNKKHPVAFCYSSDKLVRVKRAVIKDSTVFYKQPIVQQSKPASTSSVSARQHASDRPTSEQPAAEPLPPTVIVPAS
jgi:hypothetical protein